MKYLKVILMTLLLVIIMIIPVNASILTLPDLPGEFDDYIIFDTSSLGGIYSGIKAITFKNLDIMNVGTYAEYIEFFNRHMQGFDHHTHDILYFTTDVEDALEFNIFDLVGDHWQLVKSAVGDDACCYGFYGENSIQSTDILYSSKDIIRLDDGRIFFFEGSWMKDGIIRPMLGIIPYLIGFLIVLAGFLKGLQLLFRTLRKA